MPQKLQDKNGSGLVPIPKDFPERDGLLTEDGRRRIGRSRSNASTQEPLSCACATSAVTFRCDAIQRIAAQQLLTDDVYGGPTDE
ncbi:hypothetical protein [Haloarcula halophila]|uniref:hypothetical protein n=1 Tax=Haloarcula TaxID=2237 RepID=UPI0023E3D6FA|nr:hypothetical protein [Halomicroarcula sp. DFY41]